MSIYAYGAKRLWARRARKFFIVLGTLFSIILLPLSWIKTCLRFCAKEPIIGITFTVILSVSISLIYVVAMGFYSKRDADPNSIAEIFASKDSCEATTSRERFERKIKRGQPVTISDILRVKSDCEEFWQKQETISKQQKAF